MYVDVDVGVDVDVDVGTGMCVNEENDILIIVTIEVSLRSVVWRRGYLCIYLFIFVLNYNNKYTNHSINKILAT
jgi:hypothetical protein